MNCAGWFVKGDYPGNIKFQNHPKPTLCTNKQCMEKKAELLMAFISRSSKTLFVGMPDVQNFFLEALAVIISISIYQKKALSKLYRALPLSNSS